MERSNEIQSEMTNPKKSFVVNMIQDIKKSIRGEVHTLSEIIAEFDRALEDNTNIIDLIECHHGYLQESIDVLLDGNSDISDKQLHLSRFSQLFFMHGRAEEETLYRNLLHSVEREARLEGFGGQDEHEIAYQLLDEMRDLNYSDMWTEEIDAKSKVVAALVECHLKEEEDEMFPVAKKNIPGEDFNAMAEIYIEKCRLYLK